MSILELIKTRRSIREFTDDDVSDAAVEKILEAARWAPSGLNNQPWRFVVIKNEKIKSNLAKFTKYGKIIEKCKVAICVFLDTDAGYDRTKDIQAIGAAIQNMLLEIHAQGLGACWIGEILNKRKDVEKFLNVPENFELQAVISVGNPTKKERHSSRNNLKDLIYKIYE